MSDPGPGERGFVDTGDVSSKALKEFNKIKKDQWKEFGGAMSEAANLAAAGGMTAVVGGTLDSIKQNIQTQIEGMFSPITNEINQFIADLGEKYAPEIEAAAKLLGEALSKIEAALEALPDWMKIGLFDTLDMIKEKNEELGEALEDQLMSGSIQNLINFIEYLTGKGKSTPVQNLLIKSVISPWW